MCMNINFCPNDPDMEKYDQAQTESDIINNLNSACIEYADYFGVPAFQEQLNKAIACLGLTARVYVGFPKADK